MWASILSEWASLIFRWLHVIAAIGWIGSSFYFIHLDLELKPREGLPEGAHGEAWQVHGGGFYHIIKFLVAPAKMPAELTWFKWEAYTTWLSGFVLMVKQLLDAHPDPSDDVIRHYLAGNLCRCSAYPEIIDAIKLAAARRART